MIDAKQMYCSILYQVYLFVCPSDICNGHGIN
uniref:Uncharacterized protein n=1 Tax=Setaria viridis TaxID=4556 RepID=A0A4U6UTI9_SETVI|nr:hypothetical protein SEVIR_5G435766v2 [Setaria viridis]